MRPPRGLSEAERALWAQLTQSVTPLEGRHAAPEPPRGPAKPDASPAAPSAAPPAATRAKVKGRIPPQRIPAPPPRPAPPPPPDGLDSHWERRLRGGALAPDFTLDLHGHTLDQAHQRFNRGIAQARAMGARLVLVVTGRPRPVDAADRANSRGAIRANILDWLAAGPHAGDVVAVRGAQRRHGGEGALYLVLRRGR